MKDAKRSRTRGAAARSRAAETAERAARDGRRGRARGLGRILFAALVGSFVGALGLVGPLEALPGLRGSAVFAQSGSPDAAAEEELRIETGLSENSVYLGDAVLYTVRVVGPRVTTIEPDFPEIESLRFDGPQVSTREFTSIVGREVRKERTTDFTYRVTGLREGNHRIPAFPILVQGRTFRSEPTLLTVVKPEVDERIEIEAEVDRASVYPDDEITLTYRIYFARDVRVQNYAFRAPILDQEEEYRIRGVTPPPASRSEELSINGYRTPARLEEVTRRGRRYLVYEVRLLLYPPEPGRFVIPPANLTADLVVGWKTTTDLFGRRIRDVRRKSASCDPIEIEVRTLPEEGRPDGFYGLVGEFRIETEADRTEVKVGDPIQLEIRILGAGLLDRVRRPDLASMGAFEGFKIEEDLSPPDRERNRLVFRQTLRAREETVEEVPPVPLAYFDSSSGRYEVVRSAPIPLDVEPTRIVTPERIEGPGSAVGFVPKRDLEPRRGGLNTNYAYADALVDQSVVPGRLWMALAGPLAWAALAIAVRLRRRRGEDAARARMRGAKRRAVERLREARSRIDGSDREFFEALSLAMHRYLSDRFELGEGEITAVEVERLESEGRLEGEAAREAVELLDRCDSGRFGGARTAADERERWIARVERLFEEIERS